MGTNSQDPNNSIGWFDSSSSFNLNLLPPLSASESVRSDRLEINESLDRQDEAGGVNLTDAVRRIEKESKKLTDMAVTLAESVTKLRDKILLLKSVDHSTSDDRPHSAGHQDDARRRKRILDQANDHSVDDFIVNYKGGNYCGDSPDESCERDHGFCCKRARLLHTKPKALKILVPTQQSNTSLVVQDGYHWRKYGQKVTRDNPSPRAYFKCSYAPICPVKKKVQRSVEDPTVLVVTYHGEHNHKKPSDSFITGSILTIDSIVESSSNTNNNNKNRVDDVSQFHTDNQIPTSSKLAIPNLIQHKQSNDIIPRQNDSMNTDADGHDYQVNQQQKLLLQQIALSLVKEPYFATALAAAVSGNMQELE